MKNVISIFKHSPYLYSLSSYTRIKLKFHSLDYNILGMCDKVQQILRNCKDDFLMTVQPIKMISNK